MTDAVSRFPVVELDDLPDDLRERVGAIAERSGFVPNIFRALGHRPAELRAFLDYHDALMERESPLSKAERELVIVATSGANHCTYCVVAHGAILRVRARDPLLADLVATNYRTAGLPERQRRMLDFAVRLSTTPELVGEDDLAALRSVGFDDEAIWDISAITSFFALSNRMAHVMALAPNPEFHLLGRLPRG
jgi:uncharacterized peroxidase-related enzyme